VVWEGPTISGLCIDSDNNELYWSSPFEKTIYRNVFPARESDENDTNANVNMTDGINN